MAYASWIMKKILTRVSIFLLIAACSAPPLSPEKAQRQGKIVQIAPHSRVAPNFWRFQSTEPRINKIFRQNPPIAQPCYIDSARTEYSGVQVAQSHLHKCDTNTVIPAVIELIRYYGAENSKETVYWERKMEEDSLVGFDFYDTLITAKISTTALYYANRIYWQDYNLPSSMLIVRIPQLSNEQVELILPYYLRFADSLQQFRSISAARASGLSPFNALPDSLKVLWWGTGNEKNEGLLIDGELRNSLIWKK